MQSKQFEHIKELYDSGLWSRKFLKGAVRKGRITEDEYAQITGEAFEA